jgi:quercetin dioxygenase-like cupin family protein
MIRRIQRVSAVVTAFAAGVVWLTLSAWLPALTGTSVQTLPAGITRTVLVDNATVLVARLRLAPGAREEPHTHPFSAVVFQIEPGQVDMQLGDKRSTGPRPVGFAEFIPREVRHAAANVGTAAFDIVTVAIKPDRVPSADAPATAARPGITRTPVLDNLDANVARVTFAPSAREPLHSHPNDLILVTLVPGSIEVQLASERTTKAYPTGSVFFLPRNVDHLVANASDKPLEFMRVTIL